MSKAAPCFGCANFIDDDSYTCEIYKDGIPEEILNFDDEDIDGLFFDDDENFMGIEDEYDDEEEDFDEDADAIRKDICEYYVAIG